MKGFLDRIKERAKACKKTIVLPEGFDVRTIKAADMIIKEGIADIIILGKKEEIEKLANQEGADLSGVKIINPENAENLQEFANDFYEMRKSKGVTPKKALETMKNPLYYGVMMVKKDLADGMVAGATHSTADVLRPSLQILKTAPGTKLVSAFFIMVVPDCQYGENGIFLFADSGLNENPDADALSEIAISSADTFAALVEKEQKLQCFHIQITAALKARLLTRWLKQPALRKKKGPI